MCGSTTDWRKIKMDRRNRPPLRANLAETLDTLVSLSVVIVTLLVIVILIKLLVTGDV